VRSIFVVFESRASIGKLEFKRAVQQLGVRTVWIYSCSPQLPLQPPTASEIRRRSVPFVKGGVSKVAVQQFWPGQGKSVIYRPLIRAKENEFFLLNRPTQRESKLFLRSWPAAAGDSFRKHSLAFSTLFFARTRKQYLITLLLAGLRDSLILPPHTPQSCIIETCCTLNSSSYPG